MTFWKFLKKLASSALVLTICLTPLWIYLAAKTALNPVGFWQKLAAVGAGAFFLGGAQIIAAFVALIALLFIWTEAHQ